MHTWECSRSLSSVRRPSAITHNRDVVRTCPLFIPIIHRTEACRVSAQGRTIWAGCDCVPRCERDPTRYESAARGDAGAASC